MENGDLLKAFDEMRKELKFRPPGVNEQQPYVIQNGEKLTISEFIEKNPKLFGKEKPEEG